MTPGSSWTNQISLLWILKSESFRGLASGEGFAMNMLKQRKPVEGRMREGENDTESERERG